MSQGMTDNEQGYTPTTDEAARDAYIQWNQTGNAQSRRDHGRNYDQWLTNRDAETLAAHRVTLVADSREEMIDWFFSQGGDRVDAVFATDALLASGVVQVTTPTETDDEPIVRTDTWEDGSYQHIYRDGHSGPVTSRPAPVAPPTEEVDPLGPKSPDDCTHWKVGRSFGSTHGVCHSCGSQIEYDEVSPLSIIDVKPPVVPVDALGFPTQEGAMFTALTIHNATERHEFRRVAPGKFEVLGAIGLIASARQIDHTSIEDVRPDDGRDGQ